MPRFGTALCASLMLMAALAGCGDDEGNKGNGGASGTGGTMKASAAQCSSVCTKQAACGTQSDGDCMSQCEAQFSSSCATCLGSKCFLECLTECSDASEGTAGTNATAGTSGGGAGTVTAEAGSGSTSAGTAELGDDCFFNEDCVSNDCDFDLEYCTKTCAATTECPANWTCAVLASDATRKICQKPQ